MTSYQTKIYVGLNDAISHEQRFETEKYISILQNVCRSYHVSFSMNQVSGGYMHENGDYVQENTLVLSLLDVPDEITRSIAEDLCVFFHQETVLVTKSPSEIYYISEKL
ncbi:MAG: hypothetical protein II781_05315 [Clostridia bacterium]|nr:hypothetical protein [Clostridia bacterium]